MKVIKIKKLPLIYEITLSGNNFLLLEKENHFETFSDRVSESKTLIQVLREKEYQLEIDRRNVIRLKNRLFEEGYVKIAVPASICQEHFDNSCYVSPIYIGLDNDVWVDIIGPSKEIVQTAVLKYFRNKKEILMRLVYFFNQD
jgi:hypothetical protein